MANALVLTEERAAELGYQGDGPFTFGGAFPGEYLVGRPVEVRYLGFDDDAAVLEAFDLAFGELADEKVPLEFVDVVAGEGLPLRTNHALSEGDPELGAIAVELAEEAAEVTTTIRTHEDADAVAAELGITFATDPRPKLDEKIAAIEQVRAGTTDGDPDEVTPAPGAEGTTPELEEPEPEVTG